MNLVILIILTGLFLFLNYRLSNKDFFSPGFLFSLVFFLVELICLICVSSFAIHIHINTIIAVCLGLAGFTTAVVCMNRAVQRDRGSETVPNRNLRIVQPICISNIYVILLLILQTLSIIGFIYYLRNLSVAYSSLYGGYSDDSISGMIGLYDNLTKFWPDKFLKLSSIVSIPYIWRIGNPICLTCEYIILYILVNNWLAEHKINFLQFTVIILMIVRIMINGSRSPVLRIITTALTIYIVLKYRTSEMNKEASIRLFARMTLLLLTAVIVMILMLFAMGRGSKIGSLGNYFFIYTGAPLVNLDHFLQQYSYGLISGNQESILFGMQTFRSLYNYIGKIFHISSLQYYGILQFMFSDNGIEIGNVFTMFQYPIYDFGYVGAFITTFVMALYYVYAYNRVISKPDNKQHLDYWLLFYAYLINDLIMSFFSCRFYETVLDAPFIKFAVLTWLIAGVFIEHHIKIGNKVINLNLSLLQLKKILKI